jgi:tRNA threonylcarbamoyladenosine modification (KEOPS) complex  Pcc1 subunit
MKMTNSTYPKKAKIKIKIDPNSLKAIEIALKPEIETPSSDRSNTSLLIKKKKLIINTEASDISALRASLNSYLRWIQGIQKIIENIA